MREQDYPELSRREEAAFRRTVRVCDPRDGADTLQAVDDLLKALGLEVVTFGSGSDNVFRIEPRRTGRKLLAPQPDSVTRALLP